MPPLSAPVIISSLAVGAATTYAIITYTQLHRSSLSDPISSARNVSPKFLASTTVTHLINPKGFRSWGDTRSVVLRIPSAQIKTGSDDQALTKRGGERKGKGLTDEEILARFTRGFFGGWVFGPERVVLKLLGVARQEGLVKFPKCEDGVTARNVWTTSEISEQRLPGVDTIFFGGFQIVDKHILPPSERPSKQNDLKLSPEEESYVDFAYGSKDSEFAGVHRFSVAHERLEEGANSEEGETVRITMSCVTCNAREDRRVLPEWAWGFHRAYAMVLFREGVAEVLR